MSRVWFITGATRGLGRAFTQAALDAGDRVVGAARSIELLDDLVAAHPGRLVTVRVDVTDRAAVFTAVEQAVAAFGRLDIVVNNAGTIAAGAVEEFSEAEARAHMDVNFFGPLWVSQAVLPQLRAQGSGHLVQISSIGGVAAHASSGMYNAGKWALEGMSEALAMEAARFGVRTTIVEPGGYWTDLWNNMTTAAPMEAYASMRAELAEQYAEGSVDSEPRLAAEALLKLVNSDEPPLRLILGSAVFDGALEIYRDRMATWRKWEDVSRAAECAVPQP
ncbi:SDR family oxidoreductase [Streptomyces morookaense]|uniref:SDR family oxidoreductase n=1 Tax=Streptomyces morookaense TaxID=1970 RepID=A0A7Y7B286_STRMO|nr:SDR family oxidoreductase [Streptomyces morookaense]NVK77693.1 SDR family oxidoreductase [Streptomyces morookaense]GHF05242.1 short-chain dehydrogenase/reductase [Streptomyces morookaense]